MEDTEVFVDARDRLLTSIDIDFEADVEERERSFKSFDIVVVDLGFDDGVGVKGGSGESKFSSLEESFKICCWQFRGLNVRFGDVDDCISLYS